jgi:hypothetical protein
MLYELRVYNVSPGRMPDLLKRFDQITIPIWKRHGFKVVGFWTTVIGENNNHLHYMLGWDTLADREQKWAAFQADQEWITKRAETEKNGPLVASFSNSILAPTAFSPAK